MPLVLRNDEIDIGCITPKITRVLLTVLEDRQPPEGTQLNLTFVGRVNQTMHLSYEIRQGIHENFYALLSGLDACVLITKERRART